MLRVYIPRAELRLSEKCKKKVISEAESMHSKCGTDSVTVLDSEVSWISLPRSQLKA